MKLTLDLLNISNQAQLSSPASIACAACDAREGDPGRSANPVLKLVWEKFSLHRGFLSTWVPFPSRRFATLGRG